MWRFAILGIGLAAAVGCTDARYVRVAGMLHPSYSSDSFVSCDYTQHFRVDPADPILREAREVAYRHSPPSAYIEGVARLVPVPKRLEFLPINGQYEFSQVDVIEPYPGQCPPVRRPPMPANNSFKGMPLRGTP